MARNTVIGKRGIADHGFTFIEMVMVCAMIAILVAIAVPAYQSQILASKESVLKSNLAIIRERLDQFKADRGVYPQTLDELVEKGYLREMPEDPMTGEAQWEEIYEDFDPDQPEEELGIYDVRSYSADTGMNGIPYSEW
jgi:general secretion pathway protein G